MSGGARPVGHQRHRLEPDEVAKLRRLSASMGEDPLAGRFHTSKTTLAKLLTTGVLATTRDRIAAALRDLP